MFEALQVSGAALSRLRGRYSSFSLTVGMSLAPSEASTRLDPEYQLILGGGRPGKTFCITTVHLCYSNWSFFHQRIFNKMEFTIESLSVSLSHALSFVWMRETPAICRDGAIETRYLGIMISFFTI